MAVEAERLIINLEARLNKFDADMRRAAGISDRQFKRIQKQAEDTQAKLRSFGVGFARIAGVGIAGILGLQAGSQGVAEVGRLASEYVDLQNALKVAGLEGDKLTQTFGALSQISIKQGAPLNALVQLYGRISASSGDLRASQSDLLAFSDGVALSLRVSGQSAEEASGALLQLGQALGGGMIQAEEYNSLLDGARPLLQAVAAGLVEAGGSVSKLTALVKDGRVPTEAFFRAALAGFPTLQIQADKAQSTVSQASSRIKTALLLLVGNLNDLSGASEKAADFLNAVGKGIEALPGYIDAAVQGLKELQTYVQQLDKSSLLGILRDSFGAPGLASGIQPPRLLPLPVTPDSRVSGAFEVTAGTGAPEQTGAGDKVGRLGTAAEKAQVSLKDFASTADDAKKKTKLAGAPIDTASKFIGATEGRDSGLLRGFFREAQVNIDPRMTAWCAAFVNAALATNGLPGTGSLSARSFLNYGEKTDDPRRGDIVVLSRGSNAAQGHVGFFEGYDEAGNVRVLGGNQKNRVGVDTFSRDRVLGFRSIPGAERASAEDTLGAELERRRDLADAANRQAESYQDIIARGVEYIAEQNNEARAVGLTAQQAAALRYEQELLNQAASAGLTLTPQQTEQLKQLAAGMAEAEAGAAQLGMAQEEFNDIAKNSIRGLVDDLIAGKSAGEAFANVLKDIAGRLLDIALDSIFSKGGAGGGLGGILGSIFGGFRAGGGPVMSSKAYVVGEKGPEILTGASGRILPNQALTNLRPPNLRAPGAGSNTFKIDLSGARGNAEIEDAARRGAAMAIQQSRQDLARYDTQRKRTIGSDLNRWQAEFG